MKEDILRYPFPTFMKHVLFSAKGLYIKKNYYRHIKEVSEWNVLKLFGYILDIPELSINSTIFQQSKFNFFDNVEARNKPITLTPPPIPAHKPKVAE